MPPIWIMAGFEDEPFAHLLLGGAQAPHSWGGDWAMIVADPVCRLVCDNGKLYEDGQASAAQPWTRLAAITAARHHDGTRSRTCEAQAGFLSGAVGYMGYEMARYLEPCLSLPRQQSGLPDMAFGFYDAVILCHRHKPVACVAGRTREAVTALRNRYQHIARHASFYPMKETMAPQKIHVETVKEYLPKITACQRYIRDGDIFQANLSRPLQMEWATVRPTGLEIFNRLYKAGMAPFSALLQFEQGSIISQSPESFINVCSVGHALHVIASPIKGTRPRGKSVQEDKALAQELLSDPKDRAENVMIVDLVRNDLSKVCIDESICEREICTLQSFTNVHHLVSKICATLQPEFNAVDAMAASFPCGSVTGAPKIRAMEIIAGLEQQGRGVYCGGVGFFDDRGGAQISVPIRTSIYKKYENKAVLSFRSGGGITLLSDPMAEFIETEDKAEIFLTLFDKRNG